MADHRIKALSDDKLVLLSKAAADTDSFGELARRHTDGLRAFLHRVCRDEEKARDIAQSALVQAFIHIKSFRGASSFKTWLYQIGYREFLKTVRKSKNEIRLLEEARQHAEIISAADPGQTLDLADAMEALSVPEQACVALCTVFGLTHEEASKAMKMPIGTVKSHINRGRSKIDRYLNGETSHVE